MRSARESQGFHGTILETQGSLAGSLLTGKTPTARSGPFAGVRMSGSLIVMAVVAIAVVLWAILNLANGWVGFAAVVPIGFRGGGEAAISLARLFAALVLILVAADTASERVRWVASGFVVLGLGQLVFGYIAPIVEDTADLNDSLYQMILVRGVAAGLFVIGLVPRIVPRFTVRTALGVGVFCVVASAGYWLLGRMDAIPALVSIDSLERAMRYEIAPMRWLTPWHWAMAALPLGLTAIAAVGAVHRHQEGVFRTWFPLSVILLAGSELHDAFWPSTYNSILMNTADVLRLAMAAVVVIGGTMELRRIASERTALLAAERERNRRLAELETLRADFTAMVAHELGHPLTAIRRLSEMLVRAEDEASLRKRGLESILRETREIDRLVDDIQVAAAIERDDFKAALRPVSLRELLRDAEDAAVAHNAERRPIVTMDDLDEGTLVMADPDRIGQVLRNLLCNAAKYSPDDAPIALRARPSCDHHVQIEVIDRGPGIAPEDRARIFEKFGRGREGTGRGEPGVGLGLYLSRRIVRAHGSDIDVCSGPGGGSIFSFELEVVETGA